MKGPVVDAKSDVMKIILFWYKAWDSKREPQLEVKDRQFNELPLLVGVSGEGKRNSTPL